MQAGRYCVIMAVVLFGMAGCLSGGQDTEHEPAGPEGLRDGGGHAEEDRGSDTGGEPDDHGPRSIEPGESRAHATIALIDTGINPYHEAFRDDDPIRQLHPATYLEGYPQDAEKLNLSLNADSWAKAIQEDCEEVWSQIKEGQLYWIPGTKIIGAIAIGSQGVLHDEIEDPLDCEDDPHTASTPRILDLSGHGTMVASRAAGNGYGGCEGCSIVTVNGFNEDVVRWTGENSDWIDIQSNSWGPPPIWLPDDAAGSLTNSPSFVKAVEEAAQAHLAFWSTGNGILHQGGLVGHPSQLDPRLTPSVIRVGGHDSGYVATWPGFPPDVIANSCNGWAAYHDSLDASSETRAGGTSGAAPFAAGKAGQMLLHARTILEHHSSGVDEDDVMARGEGYPVSQGPLEDGILTREELKRLVKATGEPRPEAEHEDGPRCDAVDGLVLYSSTPVPWSDVPEGYPEYVHIGYGAVNGVSTSLALEVLNGSEPLPDRSDADRFFELDGDVRAALHEAWVTEGFALSAQDERAW